MQAEDAVTRLRALVAAIGSPAVPQAPELTEEARTVDGAEVQRAATAHIDALLARVANVTATLKQRDGRWDEVDQLAAQLVLADLALIAGTWRALGTIAGTRLEMALAELHEAGRDAERILKDRGQEKP